MEELEKNETSTQAEENTVSLASAQALADALAKIEAYTPTTWVDNSSPDIDAEHLNKPEQAIKRVTDALNSAVDVIKDLQSQVTKNSGAISDVNNNLPIIGKFTNKKNKDIIKIGSVVKSRSVVCVFPRYNTLTTVRCIYPSLEISAGEDQFQLFAWDTNTQNDSTSTNLEGYYIVMPMLSK